MEFKKITPGYPCSSYIVKKINTSDELWSYIKIFVKSAHERGMSCTNIIPQLIATLSNLPAINGISCPNLKEYGQTDEEICQYLINNPTVPDIKSCASIYKKIDSHTSACRLCKYSKLYRNENEDIEYSVIKYMLKNEPNLYFVADNINDDFFTSCMDVSMGIPVLKAYVLPMPKILAQSLLKPNIQLMLFSSIKNTFLMSDDPFDIIWEDAYRTFPRKRKIPANLSNNPMWQSVLKTKLRENIEHAKELTKEEIKDIFNNYVTSSEEIHDIETEKTHKSPKEKKEKFSNDFEQISLKDVVVSINTISPNKQTQTPSKSAARETYFITEKKDDFVSETTIDNNKPRELIKENSTEIKPTNQEKTLHNVQGNTISSTVTSTPYNENTIKESITGMPENVPEDFCKNSNKKHANQNMPLETTELLCNLSKNNFKKTVSDSSLKEKENKQENTVADNTFITNDNTSSSKRENIDPVLSQKELTPIEESSIAPPEDNIAEPTSDEKENDKYELISDEKTKNLIQLPILPDYIRQQMIIHIRKNKKFPASFYQGILRDKELAIEIVRGSNGAYLYLMWSRHMKKFISMNAEDCSEELKRLLSYKSIKKICHTPYVLYGVCKLFHISIKNIFSIQTVHGRLFPADEALAYIDLCKTYQTTISYGSFAPPNMVSDCCFLGGMPLYLKIHNTLMHMITVQGGYSIFIRDAFLDEALGCSYFFGLNFSDKGTLMYLIGNSHFFFNKNFYHKKITDGRYHSYYVKENIDVSSLFHYILQRLAEKGIFRKTSLQVLNMNQQQLILFIETEQEDYLSSLIDVLTFEYGRTFLEAPLEIYNMRYDI